jgi:hypothetical protein
MLRQQRGTVRLLFTGRINEEERRIHTPSRSTRRPHLQITPGSSIRSRREDH